MANCARCGQELTSAAHYCSFCGEPVSNEGLLGYLINIQDYTDKELRTLSDQLKQQELSISKHRRILHGALDIVRAEIVRRYRDDYRGAAEEE